MCMGEVVHDEELNRAVCQRCSAYKEFTRTWTLCGCVLNGTRREYMRRGDNCTTDHLEYEALMRKIQTIDRDIQNMLRQRKILSDKLAEHVRVYRMRALAPPMCEPCQQSECALASE